MKDSPFSSRLVSVIVNSVLMLFLCSATGRAQYVAQHGAHIPRNWRGARKVLLDAYLHGDRALPSRCRLENMPSVLLPVLQLAVGEGTRLTLGEEGRRLVRQMYFDAYVVQKPEGRSFRVKPSKLLQEDEFRKYRSLYVEGANIHMMSFPDGLGVPPRNLKLLILGPTIRQSYVVELLGTRTTCPQGLTAWRDSYHGKIVSKLCKVDPATGREGRHVGWIIDVMRKKIAFYGKDPEHLILKKFIRVDPNERLPQYLAARPSGLIEESGKHWMYHGEVVDDVGAPVTQGTFLGFGAGVTICDVNYVRQVPE